MDTNVDTVEVGSGTYVIEMKIRLTPGDKHAFYAAMQCAAAALEASERPQETAPAGTQSVLEDEIAGLRREALEFKQAYDKAIEEIASLTFEKQRLQAQLIGLAR